MSLTSINTNQGSGNTPFLGKLWLLTRKRLYEEIDPAIRALVDSMNAVQTLHTIASCQGHLHGKPPYVYFKAPVHVAALIEKQLRETATNNHSKLKTHWCIYGLFDGTYEQTFLLHAPEYHQRAKSLLQSIWLFGVRRRHLDTELAALTCCVEQAMRAYVGEHGKPKIEDSAG